MPIRLTESHLRQIIREEAKRLVESDEVYTGPTVTATIEITSNGLNVEFPEHIRMNPKSNVWKSQYESLFSTAQSAADFGKIQRKLGGKFLGKLRIYYVVIKKNGIISEPITMAGSGVAFTAAARGVELNLTSPPAVASPPPRPTQVSLPPITDVKSFQAALEKFDPDSYDEIMSGDFETPGELIRLVKKAGMRMGVSQDVMTAVVSDIRYSMMH